MVVAAAIGGLSFLVVCIVGGARLLALARRSRGLPELVLGSGLLLLGGVATPMGIAARLATGLGVEIRAALLCGQEILMALGLGGFALFTHRVFRPRAGWARGLAAAIPAGMLLAILATALGQGHAAELRAPGPGYVGQQVLGLVALSWTSWEALRYGLQMRRRLALGLADPVVVDRLLLWGGGVGVATLMSLTTGVAQLRGVDLQATIAGAAFVGVSGVIAAGAIYLAFFPPVAYTRWVAERASR